MQSKKYFKIHNSDVQEFKCNPDEVLLALTVKIPTLNDNFTPFDLTEITIQFVVVSAKYQAEEQCPLTRHLIGKKSFSQFLV
jgi:hypothetical protein